MSPKRVVACLVICAPLALGACAGDKSAESATASQLAAANQKADQALSTAQQALAQAQEANEKADRQYQRGLRK